MKIYGIIGFPLGHSFSKKYFTEKFVSEGIEGCSYEIFPLQSIEELKQMLAQNPGLKGFNITIPHKQSVLAYLDDRSNLPATLSACNCIKIADGKLSGYNTDIIGFERSLLPQLKNYHTHALILGNGGAAEAVKFVLSKLNIAFKVVSRKLHEGSDLTYTDLDEKIIKEHLLIINTTPLGTFPNVDECAAIPYEHLTAGHFLYDLVYNPNKTLFLQKGAAQGAATKNGYDMLVIQAEESWRIWNDHG
ncbi:shikimate dehydrogenase family protein [Ferruginibacter sp. SUN106]|uniref:shikimate dehydrogenase family protein n=1 Tax=Ferruginibacter sp. SUN106 TaxID=2978348 RepID=UPI003D36FE53